MKLEIEKSDLLDALKLPTRAVSTKSSLPALGNLLVIAQHGALEIRGTNLDQQVASFCKAETESFGSMCVPASRFRNLVSTMGDTILIAAKGDGLEIKSGNFKSTLWGLSADEFPSMQKEETEHLFNLNGIQLTDAINRCIFSASTDHTRAAINSVLFKSTSSELCLVATDGRRMSVSSLEGGGAEVSASIPILAADIIAGASKDAGSVDVKVGGSTVEVTTESTVITSKLLADSYPDYQKVMPAESLPWNKATFDRGSLIAAFKRVSLFSDKNLPALTMEFKDGVLALEAHINGQGEAREEVEGTGSDFETCVNPHYIEQMLHSVTGDEIEFWVTDKESPLRIHAEGLVYVVMPMRK